MTAAHKIHRARAGHVDPVAFLPMVQRLARRLARRLPKHIELDDLISAGVVGLMEALQRYDPARSAVFARFAEFRVRGAMLDELRRRDLMARDARTEAKHIEQAILAWRRRTGEAPEDDQLAQELGLSVAALHERLARLAPVQVLSLDDFEVDPTRAQTLGAFELVAEQQLKRLVARGIAELSLRDQQVLHLYYKEELTLREIGTVLGVTESRVSQMMSKATLQLRGIVRTHRVHKESP